MRSKRHGQAAGRKNKIAEGRKAMGIDWMTRGELSEAIPPAYSEFLGRQILAALKAGDSVHSAKHFCASVGFGKWSYTQRSRPSRRGIAGL